MKTTPRRDLAAAIDQVEDLASYEETRYLLQSPANAARLLDAIRDLDHAQGVERHLSDL
jgi:antitoxin YefM